MNHVISFEQKNSKNTCLLKGKLLSLVAAGWTCYGGYVLVLYFLLFPYKQKIKNWVTWQENSVKEHKLGRWFPSAGLWTGVSLQKFPTGPWRSSCCLTHGMPGSYTICYSKYLYINAIIKILICFLCPMEYFYFHLSAGMKGLQLSHQVSLHNLFLSWKIYFLFWWWWWWGHTRWFWGLTWCLGSLLEVIKRSYVCRARAYPTLSSPKSTTYYYGTPLNLSYHLLKWWEHRVSFGHIFKPSCTEIQSFHQFHSLTTI